MIPWWSPQFTESATTKINTVLECGFPNEGPLSLELEEYFKSLFNCKHAILTTSGTSSIFLGLVAVGVKPGDKVAVPDLTFVATASAVRLAGAIPILIDIDPDSLMICPEQLRKSHLIHKFKTVIPVHVSGRSALTSEFMKAVKELQLTIIEDAAEAFASKDPITGKFLGTVGQMGAFSFSPNKIVTSGQGGLVVTDNDQFAFNVRNLKDQGRPIRGTGGDDDHPNAGYNFKYTDLQAALLLSQLEDLEKRIKHLINTYLEYESNVKKDLPGRLLKFNVDAGEFPLWPEFRTPRRIELELLFQENGIGFRKLWHPIHTQKTYSDLQSDFPNSTLASKETLWLPSSFKLKPDDIKVVSRILNSIVESSD